MQTFDSIYPTLSIFSDVRRILRNLFSNNQKFLVQILFLFLNIAIGLFALIRLEYYQYVLELWNKKRIWTRNFWLFEKSFPRILLVPILYLLKEREHLSD